VRQPPTLRTGFSGWLGTDDLGRSMLARLLFGGAVSLSVGAGAAAVAATVGVCYGLVSGYAGGRVDALMMRAVDVLYALPSLLILMLLSVSLGAWLKQLPGVSGGAARLVVLAVAIGGVSWLSMARVVRAQVLSLRERQFVAAAIALGLPVWRILLIHIAPNLVGVITIFATLAVSQAILQESFLSFLGLGVQSPYATWGSLAAEGVRQINPVANPWWLIATPCAMLAIVCAALQVLGDGLRDWFDVRSER
jgi:ABC-type dipeptide/oligopeptide/nickel transport system permease subunit